MSALQQDVLLKMLQDEVLKDTDHNIPAFIEAIAHLTTDFNESVRTVKRICHTLKGNLQAVGFNHCSEYVHEMETQLFRIDELLSRRAAPLTEADVRMFEFTLSDCLQGLESYYARLRESHLDTPDLLQARQMPLRLLEDWNPEPAEKSLDELFPLFDEPAPQAPASEAPGMIVAPASTMTAASTPARPPEAPTPALAPVRSAQPVTAPPPATNIFLICQKGGRNFAFSVDCVTEILASQPVTPLPVPTRGVVGMVSVRGETLPVVDMSHVWRNEPSRYIVVGHVQKNSFGFEVDEVCDLMPLEPSCFQKAEVLDPSIPPGLIDAIALKNDRTILIIDLKKVLSS